MNKDKIKLDEILKPGVFLRILFPEIQVVEHMKRMGFINRSYFKRRGRIPAFNIRRKQSSNINNRNMSFSEKIYEASNTVADNLQQGAKDITMGMDGKLSKASGNIKIDKNRKSIDTSFDAVEAQMPQYVLGQENYIQKLSRAFKRPFIMGKDTGFRNIIFITGPSGSGRHLSVKAITKLLRNEGVFRNGNVFSIDLSKYRVERDAENLFLPDLYNGLYGSEPVVVFDNFEMAHQSVMDMIIRLGIDERLELSKRYREQLGRMTEVTGTLEMNVTDAIFPNEKYLVFITEKDEKSIRNHFSTRFMEKIYDIISTNNLSNEILEKITEHILEDYKLKIETNLNIAVEFTSEILNYMVESSNKSIGAHGLFNNVEKNIYNPLVELQLNNKLHPGNRYTLSPGRDGIEITDGEKTYILSKVIENRNSEGIEELNKELEKIIGLKSVKDFIRTLEDNIRVQRARESLGEGGAKLSLHMIFTGNPGTGKTTMARIMARYLKELGYLSSGHLVEVSRGDLVGQYVGETAQKTASKINSAKGGVLFIDEAYSLARDENDIFGIEAVDTLVKAIEDYREDFVVILAGYTKEMKKFLKSNSGLRSRFNYTVDFPDYTPEELLSISKVIAKSNGYEISDECDEKLIELFEKKQISGRNDSGNGRLARNIVEKAIANQSKRLASFDLSKMDREEINRLTPEDFGFDKDKEEKFNLEDKLSKVIGLEEIKNFIRSLQAQLRIREQRKMMGLPVDSEQTLHMIFKGNPGTGKTTMARIIGDVLYSMGVLKTKKFMETDRSGLVAGYVGQTALKTREKIEEALGGILFIDEAYALAQDAGSGGGFGKEAIDTLVKGMDDNRDNLVVILAGYSEDMDRFLDTNPGLRSRFANIIEFRDYSSDELMKIADIMFISRGYTLTNAAGHKMLGIFKEASKEADFGNGRYVRNLLEKALRNQALRLQNDTEITREKLITIEEQDIERV